MWQNPQILIVFQYIVDSGDFKELFQCLEDEKNIPMVDKTGFKWTVCYSQTQTLLNFLLHCQGLNLVEEVLMLRLYFVSLKKFLFTNKCRLNVY